jgi:hypothetical protein
MRTANVEFQLVPPYDHRQNAAERPIGIWKDHFVAGLASLDPHFPMHLWCRLIDQCTQTLNLMRPSRINPRLSAEAQLNGAFDYNKTPLAPPGTKVLIHETPNRCRTWAVHGADGWYLGGAPEHYRCYRVYVTKTRAERIARTVEFFPHYGEVPQLSFADAAICAASDLCWALRNPAPASPLTSIGDAQMDAIQKLADIFAVAAAHPAPTKHTPALSPASAALPRVGFQPTPHSLLPVPHTIEPETLPTPLPPSHSTSNRRSPRLHTHRIIPPDSSAYAATNLVPSQAPIEYPSTHSNAIIHETTGQAMKNRVLPTGPDSILWLRSTANDLGRLAQGVGQQRPTGERVAGTNTIFFIHKCDVPSGRKVTYCKHEASLRPRVQLCRWRWPRFSGPNCHTNSQPGHHQTSSQQHHFHA